MRTTLTIDDDIARELSRMATGKRGGLRTAVNTLLRRGLAAGAQVESDTKPFVVHGRHCGFRPGIDSLKLNALNDELESDKFISVHQRKGVHK